MCVGISPEKLDCLETMNTLRTAARLAKFQDASAVTQVLPNYAKAQRVVEVSAETLWKNEICPKIRAVNCALHVEVEPLTSSVLGSR